MEFNCKFLCGVYSCLILSMTYTGPGRQVQDKSYYLSKLRSRKQDLQAEIDVMHEEIARLQKREPINLHLEQK